MKYFKIAMIATISSCFAGCSSMTPQDEKVAQTSIARVPVYQRQDLEALSYYGGYVAGLSAIERVDECKRLMGGDEGDPASLPIRIYTASVMMLTPECGGPEKALPILETVRDQVLPLELRSLVRYQVALANFFIAREEQRRKQEGQVDSLESRLQGLNSLLKAKNHELEQLQETLNALKKIEKTFHQRNESGAR